MRLTVCTCVMLLELTNNLSMLPLVMLVLLVAKVRGVAGVCRAFRDWVRPDLVGHTDYDNGGRPCRIPSRSRAARHAQEHTSSLSASQGGRL